ncbi:MAG TPA: ABC transporter permease [Oceanithermus profundus]|uniref:ABC transporter permease n=1 Tax=Oceanithermus profundus TaxID=187137 RepID=A0A7C4VBZ6_9DEIN|nr:ABC transporter permease [Oceanithermus profundus]
MRYWRVLFRNLATWLSAEMAYREDFLAAVLTALITTAGRVFALWGMFTAGVDFGGWRFEEALLVVGAAVVLMGAFAGLVEPNLSAFSRRVFQGTLDFVFLKPLDTQFLIMFERVSLWGLPDLVAGTWLIVAAAQRLGLSLAAVLALLGGLGCAALLFYLLAFGAALVAVRSMYVSNLLHFLAAFLQAAQYPATAYGRGFRWIFTFFVPVYWMTQVPVEVVLGRVSGALFLALGFWLALALAASRLALRLAMRSYTSASS